MEVITVLITGVGGSQGHCIMKAVKSSSLPVRVIGCDSNPYSVGLFRVDQGYVIPNASDVSFVDDLINLCKKEQVAIILSGTEKDMSVLAAHKERIEKESGAFVLISSHSVLGIAMDKWQTANWLQRQGFAAPHSTIPEDTANYSSLVATGFPLLIKPRLDSGGSRGLTTVYNKEELEFYIKRIPQPVLQQLVGTEDEEYTVGTFVDKNGKCRNAIVMKRELQFGLTYKAQVAEYPEITEYVKKVAERLRPLGPCNFQMRLHNGVPTIFEINARFSSTTAMRWKFGFNDAELAIRHFVLGEEVPPLTITPGYVFRYFDEVYVESEEYEKLFSKKQISRSQSQIYKNF